jgi:hypothetical protein
LQIGSRGDAWAAFERSNLRLQLAYPGLELQNRARHVLGGEELRDVLGAVGVLRLDREQDRLLGARLVAFRP